MRAKLVSDIREENAKYSNSDTDTVPEATKKDPVFVLRLVYSYEFFTFKYIRISVYIFM